MSRAIRWALAVLLFLLPLASPGHAALSISVGLTASDVSLGEALLGGAIAAFLGFDVQVVTHYHGNQGLPLPSCLAALYLARLAGRDHHQVAGWRSRGHGWGRIAKDLGIHPGTFNKLRKGFDISRAGDNQFEEALYVWFLSQYYGVDQSHICGWHGSHQPYLGIFLALDLGSRSGRPPDKLLAARKGVSSWNAVAGQVGISSASLKRPHGPKGGGELRPKPAGGQGHGQSHGQGSHGGGHGQSK